MANLRMARVGAFLAFAVIFGLALGGGMAFAQDPLLIRNVQVLNINANCINQHVYENGAYWLAWQSAPLEGLYVENHYSFRLGDVDNDGQSEIVATVKVSERTEVIKVGKKSTTQTWGSYRIEIFENGAAYGSGPSWVYDIPGEVKDSLPNDSRIGDVDNDGKIELVQIRSTELDVFRFEGQSAVPIQEHLCTYPSFLNSLEIGDADNDGANELVVDPGSSMTPFIVWKHFPDDHWTSTAGEPIPSTLWASGMTYAGMACQRICDADNDTFNEVIATGNNQRLMVWKYNNDAYEMVSWSPELIASMAYGLDCGDLNGDGSAEVVMDLWGAKKYPARLVVLANDATGWPVKNSYSTNYGDQRDLRMGDLDGDGLPEVVMNNHGTPAGLKIFKFIGSSLSSGTFQEVYAAPGYGYGKAEIR